MCRFQGPEMGRLRVRTRHLPLLLPKLYLHWERPRLQQGTPNVQVYPAAGLCPSYFLWSSAVPNTQPYSIPFYFKTSFVGQQPLRYCSVAKLGPLLHVPGGGAGCDLGSVHTDSLRFVGCTSLDVALSFSLPHPLWIISLKFFFS